jgi:hypothetical protein
LARAGDSDPSRATSGLVLESDYEVAATREDASEGLLGCLEPEHAGCEVLQLPFTELRLLDVEPDDCGLDGVGRPVPGSRSVGGASRRHARKGEAGST